MNCDACPFNGQQKVPSEGTRYTLGTVRRPILKEGKKVYIDKEIKVYDTQGQYDVVCVGMAPAREECQKGRPFIGVSGQILRQTLANLDIEDFYLCNIFPCPISDDKFTEEALVACGSRERVVQEILERQPKLVIALGDLPLRILCPDIEYSITEVEGRVIPSKVGPLLPIVHPAYYWRHPQDFFDFIECARSGVRWINGNYTQCGEPTYEVVDSKNLERVLRDIDKRDWIAVDTETTGFAAYGWEPDHLLEMGISVDEKHAYIVPAKMIKEFKGILEKKKGIYWNGQFDAGFLKQIGISPRVEYDGMLAHYSLDERPYSHGLKKVARTYLGADNWERNLETWIPRKNKKSVSYEAIPQEVRYEYLAKDVTRTFQLKEAMEGYINKELFENLLMPASRMFIEIEYRGMRIDPVLMMQMDEILQEDLDRIDKEANELTGRWLNLKSPKEMGEYLYNTLSLPESKLQGRTTSKAHMEQFRKDYPIIDKMILYREIAKMKGTYIEGFAKYTDRNYRIHPSIKIFGSETGRLSSEHPSIMNIKSNSRLKEMFLPNEGRILIHSDIKGNELRWCGIIAENEAILEILRQGRDPHFEVAIVASKGDEPTARDKHYRTAVKAGVFGKIYGRGKDSMAQQFGWENVDAIWDAIEAVAPGLDKYYKAIAKQIKERGYLKSFFGRKRRFGLVTPDIARHVLREGVNFGPQSAGSDTMLYNMLHLWEIKDRWDIWPFWPVHDSITMDAPNSKAIPEIKKEMEDFTNNLVGGICPFIWEFEWGYNWALGGKEEE